MDHSLVEKGIVNDAGQNNCFLNVVIQSLWHLGSFRKKFSDEEKHYEPPNWCIFCALKMIFAQYQFGEDEFLPVIALRETLSTLHKDESRFELGKIADAAEALDAVLLHLHECSTPKSTHRNPVCDPPCFVHKVFDISLCHQTICNSCHATSEPEVSSRVIYYVYTAELFKAKSSDPRIHSFSDLIKRAVPPDRKSCVNTKCGKPAAVTQYLLNQPEVFTIGFVWESDFITVEKVYDTAELIDSEIDVGCIFGTTEVPLRYLLRGVICYYIGKHYNAFFYNLKERKWFLFDDKIVRPVGSWNDVVDNWARGRLKPAVLFYERLDKLPIQRMENSKPIRMYESKPIDNNNNIFDSSIYPDSDLSSFANESITNSSNNHINNSSNTNPQNKNHTTPSQQPSLPNYSYTPPSITPSLYAMSNNNPPAYQNPTQTYSPANTVTPTLSPPLGSYALPPFYFPGMVYPPNSVPAYHNIGLMHTVHFPRGNPPSPRQEVSNSNNNNNNSSIKPTVLSNSDGFTDDKFDFLNDVGRTMSASSKDSDSNLTPSSFDIRAKDQQQQTDDYNYNSLIKKFF